MDLLGRIVAKPVDKVNKKTIKKHLGKNTTKKSIIVSDKASFYKGVSDYMVNHSVGQFVKGMASTNGIESMLAILNRGFHGTYHHISKQHINKYIDEFAFRLYEGSVKHHIFVRMDNMIKGAFGKRLTYKELIA